MKQIEPFNFASPFNYSKITTPQGCHSATLSSGSRTTEHIKQGLPKSEHDLGSPLFKPFSAAFAPERAFPFVSKSVDTDETMCRLSCMNLMLHSVINPQLNKQDSVSKDYQVKDAYDLILANPPFKGTINKENINESLLAITNTTKTELLFVALFIRLLRVGGRCACIVPDGVLFGSSKAHKNLRKELIENQYLEAVISMPSGVFKPYAGVSTAILIFTKTNGTGTDKVWFYDMKADGYSLDDKRQPVQENDIPDIIERFHKKENEEDRERTEQSFMVDKQEIIDNGYDLSINKYKKIEYVPVEYPPTEEILAEIEKLNEEITKETAELRALLRK